MTLIIAILAYTHNNSDFMANILERFETIWNFQQVVQTISSDLSLINFLYALIHCSEQYLARMYSVQM